MSETFIRHFISAAGMIAVALAYGAGYFAGGRGWWWAAVGIAAVYLIIYRLLEAHH